MIRFKSILCVEAQRSGDFHLQTHVKHFVIFGKFLIERVRLKSDSFPEGSLRVSYEMFSVFHTPRNVCRIASGGWRWGKKNVKCITFSYFFRQSNDKWRGSFIVAWKGNGKTRELSAHNRKCYVKLGHKNCKERHRFYVFLRKSLSRAMCAVTYGYGLWINVVAF